MVSRCHPAYVYAMRQHSMTGIESRMSVLLPGMLMTSYKEISGENSGEIWGVCEQRILLGGYASNFPKIL